MYHKSYKDVDEVSGHQDESNWRVCTPPRAPFWPTSGLLSRRRRPEVSWPNERPFPVNTHLLHHLYCSSPPNNDSALAI